MATDKNTTHPRGAQPQTTESGEEHINPFREPVNEDKPTPEEEAESEQQLKEAMTERD